jgi:colanic acid biosynthesis glycosyl transferase WcaI
MSNGFAVQDAIPVSTPGASGGLSEGRRMKILIFSINYWPEVTGIGACTTYRAEHLASAGHDVEVCTTFPYYPDWKVAPGYTGKLATSETRNGVRIRRSYCYVPNRVTPVRRILHEASFVASATAHAVFCKRPDVLLVVSPPLGLAFPAILLSRIWRIPYVFDVEDLQPDSAADLGMLPRPALKILYSVEGAAYRYAGLVTTLTTRMKERIVAKGVAQEKVELVEPRMDESLSCTTPEEAAAFRERYDLGDKFLVTHSGNIGVKQKLDVVIDAAALNRSDDSMLFLIVGNGADCARIRRRARELDLLNVRFLPLLDEQDFRGLLAASNVCLVTQQKLAMEIAFPSKMVTYLAAGRPIVVSVNPEGEVARIANESGAGRVAMAADPADLLNAILDMRSKDLRELGNHAREYALRRWSSVRVLGNLERCLAGAAFAGRPYTQEEPVP